MKLQYLDYHWVGGVTTTKANLKVTILPSLVATNNTFHLSLTLSKAGTGVAEFSKTIQSSDMVFSFEFNNLDPKTEYQFKYKLTNDEDDSSEERQGRFRTFADDGSLKFVAGSCANTMSDSAVFEHMASNDPDFVLNLGDMHYAGVNSGTKKYFAEAYHEIFKSNEMRSLYENNPIVYTFDDHDAGSDNTDGKSFSINQVNQLYREIIPHYPLTSSTNKGIQ